VIDGQALEATIETRVVDCEVFVLLPPINAVKRFRRYWVGCVWHGFFIGAEPWKHEIHVP
jgi:hypothetical protein